jgi:hypothetical protein
MKLTKLVSSGIVLTVLAVNACQKKNLFTDVVTDDASNQRLVANSANTSAASNFTLGTLSATAVVPKTSLLATGGQLGGNKILVDNMPEKIKTEGWVFAPPRINNNTVKQGVSGNVEYYTFHFNTITKNGVGQQAYYVLLASNPNSSSITASVKGSILTKTDAGGFSFSNPSYFIEKESYEVSKRFINSNHTVNTGSLSIPALGNVAGNYTVLTYKAVNYNDGVDGRFTLNFSNTAYVYAVMVVKGNNETTAQMLTRAVNLATSDNFTAAHVAKRADGEWNDQYGWIAESTARYGRESGLYNNSAWLVNQTINLPATAGYLGMCMVVDQKNITAYPEDQTAPYSALVPTDTRRYSGIGTLTNSTRTWGNYGHYYDISLNLVNSATIVRNIKINMAFNAPDPTKPNARFVGYAKVKDATLPEVGVDIKIRLNDPKANLLTTTVPANSSKIVKIRFYVPGLITAGNQLIVEALN